MLTANQAKFVAALQVKKYRQKYRKFVVEGEKMVGELLAQHRLRTDSVFCLERWAAENAVLAAPFSEKINLVSEAELRKISTLTTPNKVLAVVEMPSETPDFQALAGGFSFYLDGLQDPGNLGSILRIADWFGFRAVFCSPDSVDAFSPKVVQAGMGASLRVPTWEMPLSEILANLPAQTPVLGAVMDGENLFRAVLPPGGVLVIGNEGRGISPETERLLTHRLTIPRAPGGGAESLNAAIAAGILAAQVGRAF